VRGGRKERKKEREGGREREDAQWKRIRGESWTLSEGEKSRTSVGKYPLLLSLVSHFIVISHKKMYLLFKICLTFTLNMDDERRLDRWKDNPLSRGKFT